jgi:hypothetical protein
MPLLLPFGRMRINVPLPSKSQMRWRQRFRGRFVLCALADGRHDR